MPIQFPAVVGSPQAEQIPKDVAFYQGEQNKLALQQQDIRQNNLSFQSDQIKLHTAQQLMQDDMKARSIAQGMPPGSDAKALSEAFKNSGLYTYSGKLDDAIAKRDQETMAALAHKEQAATTALVRKREILGQQVSITQLSKTPEEAVQRTMSNPSLEADTKAALVAHIQSIPAQEWDSKRMELTSLALDAHNAVTAQLTAKRDAQTATRDTATAAAAAATTAEQVRGHDLTRKTAKEQLAARETADKPPTLGEVVDPLDATRMLKIDARTYKGGSLGAPGVIGVAGKVPDQAKLEKNLTEDQGKATSWLERMKQSEDVITKAPASAQTATGSKTGMAGAVIDSVPIVGSSGFGHMVRNAIESPERQSVRTAQETWVQGLLRSDTGAAYKEMEKDDIIRAFFWQPGESESQKTIKEKLRDGVSRAMQVRAGPGIGRLGAVPEAASGLPSAEAISAERARRAALKGQ